jgi:hypothetical protein
MMVRLSTAKPRIASAQARSRKRVRGHKPRARHSFVFPSISFWVTVGLILTVSGWWFHSRYTLTFQSPVRLQFQSPIVIAEHAISGDAADAQADQHGRGLSAWQQYACRQFGPDCRLALAIQRAENPHGKCEIYHYNSDGTLDWGYFQINTVHLKRPGLNLRDLLDCKANIDFAYQLYREKGGFTPWSTFNNGAYRQFMTQRERGDPH